MRFSNELVAELYQPFTVRRSLTWDQGPEMRDWKQVAELNDRPRKRFSFRKPDELIGDLLKP